MRVLLLQPPAGARFGISRTTLVEPLGLEMVGASLKSCGHSVRLIDLRLDRVARLDALLESFRPSAVGISCGYTTDVYTTLITAHGLTRIVPILRAAGSSFQQQPPSAGSPRPEWGWRVAARAFRTMN